MKIFSNKHGFTLTEILISVAVIGVLSLVSMSIMQSNSKLAGKNQHELQLAQLKYEINKNLTKQSDCNANFASKPTGVNLPISTTLNGIYKCQKTNPNTDDCLSSGSKILWLPSQNLSWEQNETMISNKIRIMNSTYTVNPSSTAYEYSTLTLNISIELKEQNNNIKTIQIKNNLDVIVEGGTIKGCNIPLTTKVQNCVGQWGACSTSCGPGIETFYISQNKNEYGESCTNSNGETRNCNLRTCGVDCVGNWSPCSNGVMKFYSIVTPASGGGAACPANNGDMQSCVSVNCVGSWGACTNGVKTYTITTPASEGGTPCSNSNGESRACKYNCVCHGNPPLINGDGCVKIGDPSSSVNWECPSPRPDYSLCWTSANMENGYHWMNCTPF